MKFIKKLFVVVVAASIFRQQQQKIIESTLLKSNQRIDGQFVQFLNELFNSSLNRKQNSVNTTNCCCCCY